MRYFPIFVDLDGRKVVLAGGGEAAMQKLRLVLKTSAQVSVYSEEICDEISGHVRSGRINVLRRAPAAADIAGTALVYAATGDEVADEAVSALARAAGVPVNVVDRSDLSDFITPAIVDRDPVTVAIGTEGTAPVLARTIKAQIEAFLPASTGAIARLAGAWRQRLATLVPQARARRRVWQRFFAKGIPAKDDAPSLGAAQIQLAALTRAEMQVGEGAGFVSLLVMDADDPARLTALARRRLHQADVVVFDRDAAPRLRELTRREAKFLPVGPGRAVLDAPGAASPLIPEILLGEASDGQRIVRLIIGVWPGRAEAERIALRRAGIDHELVGMHSSAEPGARETGHGVLPRQLLTANGAL